MDAGASSSPSNDLFTDLVHQLCQTLLPPATSSVAEDCSGFLLQCSLQFEMQLQWFTTDRTKIAYITLLLSGRAFQWEKSIWEQGQTVTCMLDAFITHLREVFGQAANSISVHDQLYHLWQGNSSLADYALQFQTLTAVSCWNEAALITTYCHGLQLAIYNDSMGLENLSQRSIG